MANSKISFMKGDFTCRPELSSSMPSFLATYRAWSCNTSILWHSSLNASLDPAFSLAGPFLLALLALAWLSTLETLPLLPSLPSSFSSFSCPLLKNCDLAQPALRWLAWSERFFTISAFCLINFYTFSHNSCTVKLGSIPPSVGA